MKEHHVQWQELLDDLDAWTLQGCQQLEETLKHRVMVSARGTRTTDCSRKTRLFLHAPSSS